MSARLMAHCGLPRNSASCYGGKAVAVNGKASPVKPLPLLVPTLLPADSPSLADHLVMQNLALSQSFMT